MTDTTPALVWGEIPVANLSAAITFYETVTGRRPVRQQMGPNETAVLAGAEGAAGAHLYEGRPAGDGTGPTLHLVCTATLEATMERCTAAGGRVVSPAITIPAGRFAYATDPDGNSIGLFEAGRG